MNLSIEFSPVLPVEVLIVLGLAAFAALTLGILKRARGAWMRLVATAAVFLALLDPVARDELRTILPDVAVVVTDLSRSQTIDGRAERAIKTERRLKTVLKTAKDLEAKYVTVRPHAVPNDEGTQLFKALNEALSDVPPERFAGAVLITDGQVHDVPQSLKAQGYDGPVQTLITGRKNERDRRIVIEEAPKFGIVGQRSVIRFRVEDHNLPPGSAEVVLSRGGQKTERLNVPVGRGTEVEIAIDHGGVNITELAAAPVVGELTETNNRVVVLTDGVRDRLRVLLVSGEPHAGERAWRNLLKSDAAVDLVHFTILRPPEKQDSTPINELSLIAFPTRELFSQKLDEFDLIIFDRYRRRGVLPLVYLANVSQFVEDGGAVLTAVGPAFSTPLSLYRTPLATILPSAPTGEVIMRPYRPTITARGRRHPVTRDLEGGDRTPPGWGRWFRLIDVDPRQGEVVMNGPSDRPLMILDRVGKGRVAQLLSDHVWLWARGFEGGGPQAEMLRRLAHWLMKEPDLEEEALLGVHKGQTLTIERRTMSETARPVTITSPSGKQKTVELKKERPGVWRTRLAVNEVGVHRLKDDALSTVAAVGSADPKELAEIVASPSRLADLMKESGGRAFWVSSKDGNDVSLPAVRRVAPDRSASGHGWLGLKRNGAYRVESLREFSLFSSLPVLAALLFLLAFAWYREGR